MANPKPIPEKVAGNSRNLVVWVYLDAVGFYNFSESGHLIQEIACESIYNTVVKIGRRINSVDHRTRHQPKKARLNPGLCTFLGFYEI